MTTQDKLTEIRARRSAIGNPWPATVKRDGVFPEYVTVGPFADIKDNGEGPEEDYEFVAHAPTDIDFLLGFIDERYLFTGPD